MAGGCTFTVNRAAYLGYLSKADTAGRRAVGEQALADCNEFVKVDQNDLKQSGRVETIGSDLAVTYNTKYALAQYYLGTAYQVKNPRASMMWCHKAAAAYGGDWHAIMVRSFTSALR